MDALRILLLITTLVTLAALAGMYFVLVHARAGLSDEVTTMLALLLCGSISSLSGLIGFPISAILLLRKPEVSGANWIMVAAILLGVGMMPLLSIVPLLASIFFH